MLRMTMRCFTLISSSSSCKPNQTYKYIFDIFMQTCFVSCLYNACKKTFAKYAMWNSWDFSSKSITAGSRVFINGKQHVAHIAVNLFALRITDFKNHISETLLLKARPLLQTSFWCRIVQTVYSINHRIHSNKYSLKKFFLLLF